MNYQTAGTISNRILQELDMIDEEIVSPSEVYAAINEGVKLIASEILTLYEDYFLKRATIDMVNLQATYTLPPDIFATKIRKIIYTNGAMQYAVEHMNGLTKGRDVFALIEQINTFGISDWYRYILFNSSPTSGLQLQLVPPSRETLAAGLVIYYLREPNYVAISSDLVDIPEGYDFVVAYGKLKCTIHEGFADRIALAQSEVEMQRKVLIDTLATMVPDDDNIIQGDFSTYLEHS